ncbi:MAG: DUF6176 family protein [Hydrococcus sp. Prado102]|jgi:hypothetical protein|nr:DUF6176 family protein [Hydrococcus sp. Prado102]
MEGLLVSDKTQCFKIKLKPGITDYVVFWIKNLSNQRDRIQQILSQKGIILESIFLEKSLEGDYLILYQKKEDLGRNNEVFNLFRVPFEPAIQQFINNTVEDVLPLKMLFDCNVL